MDPNDVAATSGAALGVPQAGEWASVGRCDNQAPKTGSESLGVSTAAATESPSGIASGKVCKGRDKLARLRKRLKCYSVEQLVNQMLELVRTDAVTENAMFATMSSVDVNHLLQKCEKAHYVLLSELPRETMTGCDVNGHTLDVGDDTAKIMDGVSFAPRSDAASGGAKSEQLRELDSAVAKQYRRNFTQYRTCVVSNGKLLQDANLWKELVSFCVGAAAINQRVPIRAEEALNKLTRQVWTRVEQYVRKGATEFIKIVKGEPNMTPEKAANVLNTLDKLIEDCVRPFPGVAQMLRDVRTRLPSAHDGSAARPQHGETNSLINGAAVISNAVSSLAEAASAPRKMAHGAAAEPAGVFGADGGATAHLSNQSDLGSANRVSVSIQGSLSEPLVNE